MVESPKDELRVKTVKNGGRDYHVSLYHIYLMLVIYGSNIVVANNEVFMVFGGVKPSVAVNCSSNCTTWAFDSLVKHWSLDSLQTWVISVITSAQYIGSIFGCLFGGYLADAYGRKLNTVLAVAGNIFTAFISAFCASHWALMAVCRFVLGIANGMYITSASVLVMESLQEGLRIKAQFSLDVSNSVSFIWMSLLAYLIREWYLLTIISSLQGIPVLIAYLFVQESPMWLIKKGRTADAEKVLEKIWGCGKICRGKDYYSQEMINNEISNLQSSMNKNVDEIQEDEDLKEKKTSYMDLFASRQSGLYAITVLYCMFVCGVAGFTIIYNAGNLVGNLYLNFALIGAVNIFSGIVTLILERVFNLGRRVLLQIGLIGVTLGFTVIIILYLLSLETSLPYLLIGSALVGSAFSFILWPVNTLYSCQLFPTHLRNKSSGLGMFGSRIGAVIAPLIIYLFGVWKPLPFIIVAIFTSINFIWAYFVLPEPGETLFEQIQDQSHQKTNEY